MQEVVLIFGGNQGNVPETFRKCMERFKDLGYEPGATSSLYSSPPWGYESANSFYNQVFEFETNKSPQEVLNDCLSIENELGRIRDLSGEYHDRTIDIDILFYAKEIIAEENLVIPHPRLHQRKFCLVPLNEIIPEFVHPKLEKNIRELLNECEDKSIITRE